MLSGPSGTICLLTGVADVFRSRSRLARGARLALSATVAVSALALIVFHAALLWNQIGDGRVLDPVVAVRWGVGAVLLGALAALRRAGVPLLWGRRALVVWVLVAVMHVTAAPATDRGALTDTAPNTTQVVTLPTAAAATWLLAATLLLLGLLRPGHVPHSTRGMRVRWLAPVDARTPIVSLHLASRAPPDLFA